MNGGSVAWYASPTIWAGVVGFIVPLLSVAFHVSITDAQVQEIAVYIASGASAIAGLAAIWYRLKASHPISGTKAAAAQTPVAGAMQNQSKGA